MASQGLSSGREIPLVFSLSRNRLTSTCLDLSWGRVFVDTTWAPVLRVLSGFLTSEHHVSRDFAAH